MADIKLTPEVRDVLERSVITRTTLTLPEQLPRSLYDAVMKVIKNAGGQWSKRDKFHVFSGDPRVKLGLALETGVSVDEKKKFQFFPTPPELAERVVQRASVRSQMVLEPSAGMGALAYECRDRGATQVVCIELEPERVKKLKALGFHTIEADFLTQAPPKTLFDRVVMNPPFNKGQDLKHLAHAFRFLKPGGRLVAILLPHDEDEITATVGEHCSFTTEAIEEGAFAESGTNIRTMMLVLDKDHRAPVEPWTDPEVKAKPEPLLPPLLPPLPKPQPQPAMLKTQINPENLQSFLESARNAAQKGQAQYLTPVAWGKALARGLPQYRPAVVDFHCGHGHLLAGVAGPSTNYLLGCDIDATTADQGEWTAQINARRVVADTTKFFSLLHKVRWEFDIGAFNPPFDLHQYREVVAMLADSHCWAVTQAFKAHDGRTSKDTIDSTVLTLCMALDRMSYFGEAFIINNQDTIDRLILAPDAPHGHLRDHCWRNIIIPGNICDPKRTPESAKDSTFRTGILFFARDHSTGFDEEDTLLFGPEATAEEIGERLAQPDFRLPRRGGKLRPGLANEHTASLWNAAKEEWEILTADTRSQNKFNLWLEADGTIRTNLSLFDTESGRVNKQEADRLFQLNGKSPMHLVMARESRRELERAALGTRWRVAPAVVTAVHKAIEDYNRARAPLTPLNDIQRLGYIDEYDMLLCKKDLGGKARRQVSNLNGKWVGYDAVDYDATIDQYETVHEFNSEAEAKSWREQGGQIDAVFKAGESYTLKAETVRTERKGTKMNLEGSLDDVQYDGSELAIWLDGGEGRDEPKLFMEARLMESNVRLSIQKEGEPTPINYTLHQLTEHFVIPDVPDVAAMNPEGYAANLALLAEIEQIVA